MSVIDMILTFSFIRRNPKSLVKPPKKDNNENSIDENRYKEEVQKCVPKASRHLFLIRHGQYIMDGTSDTDRYLTDLGIYKLYSLLLSSTSSFEALF